MSDDTFPQAFLHWQAKKFHLDFQYTIHSWHTVICNTTYTLHYGTGGLHKRS